MSTVIRVIASLLIVAIFAGVAFLIIGLAGSYNNTYYFKGVDQVTEQEYFSLMILEGEDVIWDVDFDYQAKPNLSYSFRSREQAIAGYGADGRVFGNVEFYIIMIGAAAVSLVFATVVIYWLWGEEGQPA